MPAAGWLLQLQVQQQRGRQRYRSGVAVQYAELLAQTPSSLYFEDAGVACKVQTCKTSAASASSKHRVADHCRTGYCCCCCPFGSRLQLRARQVAKLQLCSWHVDLQWRDCVPACWRCRHHQIAYGSTHRQQQLLPGSSEQHSSHATCSSPCVNPLYMTPLCCDFVSWCVALCCHDACVLALQPRRAMATGMATAASIKSQSPFPSLTSGRWKHITGITCRCSSPHSHTCMAKVRAWKQQQQAQALQRTNAA